MDYNDIKTRLKWIKKDSETYDSIVFEKLFAWFRSFETPFLCSRSLLFCFIITENKAGVLHHGRRKIYSEAFYVSLEADCM